MCSENEQLILFLEKNKCADIEEGVELLKGCFSALYDEYKTDEEFYFVELEMIEENMILYLVEEGLIL